MSRRKPLPPEPVQRTVAASKRVPPKTSAVCWVFDLALAAPKRTRLRAACPPPPQPTTARVMRDEDGNVRVEGGQYPANRWTLEREEQERQRRATVRAAEQRTPEQIAAASAAVQAVRERHGLRTRQAGASA